LRAGGSARIDRPALGGACKVCVGNISPAQRG
jgi:hypothetical protein